jgi:hypothetical protein
MSQKYVIAGVGSAELIDKTSGEKVADANTLVNSGMNFTVTAEDIRGGLANKLLAQYFHDSGLSITLEDALFDLNYIAINTGSTISVGGDVMTTEQVTSTLNTITVTGTPRPFLGLGTIGWYQVAGTNTWTKITFTGSVASPTIASGQTVCVRYVVADTVSEQITVSSTFIPDQCYMLLTLPIFKTGLDTTVYSSASRVGEIQVEVPTFQLSGAMDMALTSSGTTTSNISGNALASTVAGAGCSSDGVYANIKKIIFNQDEFANVLGIVVLGSDVDLTVGDTETLTVLKYYGGKIANSVVDNSKLSFTSTDTGVCTVGSHTGLLTAISDGSATIEIFATTVPTLTATATVTVTT